MRPLALLIPLSLLGTLAAQELRHAVVAADLVVLATDVGVQPIAKNWIAHRLRIAASLKGTAPEEITVVELRGVANHQKPVPGEQRLYCLRDFAQEAAKAELPANRAPYYKMQGQPGSNPKVTGSDAPECALTRAILAAEASTSPAEVSRQLLALVLRGTGDARLEATKALTERAPLLQALDTLSLSDLTTRAAGETDDIPFKIALAELCAERAAPELVDALCLSLDQIEDPRLATAIGRIAVKLHGDASAELLQNWLGRARNPKTRAQLLLALGATSTDKALDALLKLKGRSPDEAIAAALRAHGAPRALDALSQDRGGAGR